MGQVTAAQAGSATTTNITSVAEFQKAVTSAEALKPAAKKPAPQPTVTVYSRIGASSTATPTGNASVTATQVGATATIPLGDRSRATVDVFERQTNGTVALPNGRTREVDTTATGVGVGVSTRISGNGAPVTANAGVRASFTSTQNNVSGTQTDAFSVGPEITASTKIGPNTEVNGRAFVSYQTTSVAPRPAAGNPTDVLQVGAVIGVSHKAGPDTTLRLEAGIAENIRLDGSGSSTGGYIQGGVTQKLGTDTSLTLDVGHGAGGSTNPFSGPLGGGDGSVTYGRFGVNVQL